MNHLSWDRREICRVKMARGYAKYHDFEEVALNRELPVSVEIADICSHLAFPEDVAYYLGKNPAILNSLGLMSHKGKMRLLFGLESTLQRNKKPGVWLDNFFEEVEALI